MITTNNANAKRLIAALGAAAGAAVVPGLLFVGAGTAHADDPCYGSLQGSYYCSPASGSGSQSPEPAYTPVQPAFGYSDLPQCSGGALAALGGIFSGEGC
jgi:hypothetical protein